MAAFSHVKSDTIGDFTGTITGFNSQGSTTTIAATDLVRPVDWNSAHNFFQTISGDTGGQSTASGTNLVIGGTNGVSVSLSTAANAATLWLGVDAVSTWNNMNNMALTQMGQQANNSCSVVPFLLNVPVSLTQFNVFGSQAINTAANNSTAGINYSLSVLIATLNGATLSTLSSGSTGTGITWSSNNTSGVIGQFAYSAPLNGLLVPGNYFAVLHMSTASTGGVITGAATTGLGNTISMIGVGTAQFGAFSIRPFTSAATNSTLGPFNGGLNSSTGNLTQVSMSNVTQVGTVGLRGGAIMIQLRA